jgi:hypothetical protein
MARVLTSPIILKKTPRLHDYSRNLALGYGSAWLAGSSTPSLRFFMVLAGNKLVGFQSLSISARLASSLPKVIELLTKQTNEAYCENTS